MRPVLEWCAVCLQDDVKVLAIQVIQQVPLCKGCVVAYGEEKDVLRDAREFIHDLDSDEPATAPDTGYFTPEPAPPAVKHLCICGCGTSVSTGGMLLPGHAARKPEPTPPSTKREPDKPLTPAERKELLATPAKKSVEMGECEKCGDTFEVKHGASGRFCSRECYEEKRVDIANQEKRTMKLPTKQCVCGCGETFSPTGNRQVYADGHKPKRYISKKEQKSVVLPPVIKGDRIITSEEITKGLELLKLGVPMKAIAVQFNLKYPHVRHHLLRAQCGIDPHKPETFHLPTPREMSIERSQTMKVTVREQPEEDRHEIQIKRKVTILVPGAKPVTQVKVTPEIAQSVWESLTLEQKALLMDIDSMWNDWDDWLRCETVGKILLISPDDAAQATTK